MTQEQYEKKVKRIVITEEQIREAITALGKEIDREYAGKPLLLVSILNGAFVFMADVCRAVSIPCEIAFMCAKSFVAVDFWLILLDFARRILPIS